MRFLFAALAAWGVGASPLSTLKSRWQAPEYITSRVVLPSAINVHIQPHSHCDLGWLKTFDEYLIGSNNSIQAASVQSIYDSVLAELSGGGNINRTFHAVETGFLMRYLESRPPSVTKTVQQLLASGQLTVSSGGWVMPDEACPTWIELADALSLGHRLLASVLGPAAIPRVGWQIDPFGHSSTFGSQFTAGAGQSGLFYGRMDMEERAQRWMLNASEYVWRPSGSLGRTLQMLAGFNIHGYDPPVLPSDPQGRSPYYFDIAQDSRDVLYGPFQDNLDWENVNVDLFVAATLEIANAHAAHILPDSDGTVHIAWQFGTDFNYRQSMEWYRSVDKLIHYVNLNTTTHGIHLLYSSPTQYMDAKLAQNIAWPLKTDDQFPYWGDQKHWTWVGFYASRPAFKGYVRDCSGYFTAARQLQAFVGGAPDDALSPSNPLYRLERALGTAMHHDAVTGTERQHVAYDYALQLAAGVTDADMLVAAALANLTGYVPPDAPWSRCVLANASISCASLEQGLPTIIVVYNSQSHERVNQSVRIPVGLPQGVSSWRVLATDGVTALTAQLLPTSRRDVFLRESYYGAPAAPGDGIQWLVFLAPSVPAMGFAAYFLEPSAKAVFSTHQSRAVRIRPGSSSSADQHITNGVVTLTISGSTGLLSGWSSTATGISTPLLQEFLWYNASSGNAANDGTGGSSWGQASTTYIFRPNSSTPFPPRASPADVEILTGPVVSEVRQYMGAGDWICNVLRLYATAISAVESEWTVGAIPVSDGFGKEIIMRISVGGAWANASGAPPVLWTDSNGLEMQRRVLNQRPSWNSTAWEWEPVASNYYPVSVRAYIEEPSSGDRLSLVPDRAQGCASLAVGQLECMLHRRLLFDNFLGNGEALNEPGLNASCNGLIARGSTWIMLDNKLKKASAGHVAALDSAMPLQLLTAPLDASPSAWLAAPGRASVYFGLAGGAVAQQLSVMTTQSLGAGKLLVRVQHVYEAGEDDVFSANATIALAELFPMLRIASAVETSIAGVQALADIRPWTLQVEGEPDAITLPILPPPPAGAALSVELCAASVRTFVLTLS